jgi:hypothetical protein
MSSVRLQFHNGASRRSSVRKDSEDAFADKVPTGEVWQNPVNGKRYAVYTDAVAAPTKADFEDIHADDSKFSAYVRNRMRMSGQSVESMHNKPLDRDNIRVTREPLTIKGEEAGYLEMVARQRALAEAEVAQTIDGTAREVEHPPTLVSEEAQYSMMRAAAQTASAMAATTSNVKEIKDRGFSSAGADVAVLKRHRHARDKPRRARNTLRKQLPGTSQHQQSKLVPRELAEGVTRDTRPLGAAPGTSHPVQDTGVVYAPDAEMLAMHRGPTDVRQVLFERQHGGSFIQRTEGVYPAAEQRTVPPGPGAPEPAYGGVNAHSTLYEGYVPPTVHRAPVRRPVDVVHGAVPTPKESTHVPRDIRDARRWEGSLYMGDAGPVPSPKQHTYTLPTMQERTAWKAGTADTQQVSHRRFVPLSEAGPNDRVMGDVLTRGAYESHKPYPQTHAGPRRTAAPETYVPPRTLHGRRRGFETDASLDNTAHAALTADHFADVQTRLKMVPKRQGQDVGFLPHHLLEPKAGDRTTRTFSTGALDGAGLGQGRFQPQQDALPASRGRMLERHSVGPSEGGRALVTASQDALGVGKDPITHSTLHATKGYGDAAARPRYASPARREGARSARTIGGSTAGGVGLARKVEASCGYSSDASGFGDE